MLIFIALPLAANNGIADTTKTHELKTFMVNGQRIKMIRASLPQQSYSTDEIKTLNAFDVSDVAKHFSGVTVKDYGGIGGLKTVSIRGMGSCFTGVSYDGILMSDIQSGQVDLGRFSLENVSEITLSNGQPDDIFQTARAFASAGLLSIKTKLLPYNTTKSFEGDFRISQGSFGMLKPSIFMAKNIAKKWAFNFSTDGIMADGEYPFLQYYGARFNKSELLHRTNSDVKSLKMELNTEYRIKTNETLSLKVNEYVSERGLPGSVTFYNTDISNQRLNDQVFYTQLHYENKLSKTVQHQYSARYNRAYNHFSDKDGKYQDGFLDEHYLQQEFYLSSTVKANLLKSLQASVAADWWFNNLDIQSNIYFKNFAFPTRQSGLANVAFKYVTDNFSAGANLLYTLTREKVKFGNAAPDRDKLSPCVNLSYKPINDKEFRVRAFYKNIYRLPTFNDLYYQEVGNANLRPENANQFNVGCTYLETKIPFLSSLEITTDAYYNHVKDKIVAIPRDLFHWSMINKGLVSILGLDVTLRAAVTVRKTDQIRLISNYSFQSATDKTPNTDNYGEQIPYTPAHSGTASLVYQHSWWDAGYNMQFVGTRWVGQLTDRRNKLEAYNLHSLFANFRYKRWELKTEVLNLFNTQYDVVQFYPMPRLNYRITVGVKL